MKRFVAGSIVALVMMATPAVAHPGGLHTYELYRDHHLAALDTSVMTDEMVVAFEKVFKKEWVVFDERYRASLEPDPVPVVAQAASAPAAPTQSYGIGSVQQIIIDAANEYGISPEWLLSIASCESGFNPRAYNPAGPYIGLFQYHPDTWANNGYGSIYDPVAQSRTTARMLSQGGASHWGCA